MWENPYFLDPGSRLERIRDITEIDKSERLVGGDKRDLGELPTTTREALVVALQLHPPLPS